MKKLFLIFTIIILVSITAIIKNTTKKIEDQIFAYKESVRVLKSNFLTQGPMVPKFENEIKKFTNSKFATAVNSATSGLHIACLALGLKNLYCSLQQV